MNAMIVCAHCSTSLRSGQTYCDECGSLIHANRDNVLTIECEAHPDHRAVGLCVVCAKPVCIDCEVKTAGKILCHDPEHGKVLQEWRKIFQPDSEFEAEALVRNLADNGIAAKTFSLHDHVATRWLNEIRIFLFVKISESEQAVTFLKELNLIDSD